MAPEQFRSLRLADTRSDIFSFGAMLYEMLTGVQLFASMNAAEMARLAAPVPDADEINPAVPRDLSAIVTRCLAYDPACRYQFFSDLFDALSRINEALPGGLPIPTDAQHAARAAVLTPSLEVLGETYSLISLGRYEDAAACAQRGIDIDPTNHEHWVNRGKALGELKNFPAAQQCCVRATEMRPRDAQVWANLAWVTLVMGEATTALSQAKYATRLDNQFCDGWLARGCCERTLGQMERALRSLTRATELEPYNWKAHANLGFCLADVDRNTEAVTVLRRAAQINPKDAMVWSNIARLLAAEGQPDQALEAIDRALQIDSSRAETWALRALVLWQGKGDLRAARATLARALTLDASSEQAQSLSRALEATTDRGL